MTSEFGPLNPENHDPTSGVTGWLADKMVAATVRGYTHFLDSSIRYDATQNRLSLHGESEHAGEGFAVGVIATLVVVSAGVLSSLPIVVAGELSMFLERPMPSLVAVMALAGVAWATINVFEEIMNRVTSIEVYDHRTVAHDDERIEELADGYVDGELDREEFAAEVETVFEREAER